MSKAPVGKVRSWALAATVALGLAATGCASSEASDSADEPISIGITSSVNNASMSFAIDDNLGENHGVKLERQNIAGAGSTNQVSALLARDIQIGVGGTNTIVDAYAQGADIQIIAGMAPLLFSLTVAKEAADATGIDSDAPIEDRIQALKGMKIAASPPGSTGNLVLRAMLEMYGLDPDTDVTLVPLNDLGAVPSGLMEGTYDASFAAIGNGEVAVSSGDAVTWVSLPEGEIELLDQYQGIVAYASTDYIENNPEAIQGVVDSLNEAQEIASTDPERAAQTLKKTVFEAMDDEIFEMTWEQVHDAYTPGSQFTPENWEVYVDLFNETSEHNYEEINYEDLIAEIARGE